MTRPKIPAKDRLSAKIGLRLTPGEKRWVRSERRWKESVAGAARRLLCSVKNLREQVAQLEEDVRRETDSARRGWKQQSAAEAMLLRVCGPCPSLDDSGKPCTMFRGHWELGYHHQRNDYSSIQGGGAEVQLTTWSRDLEIIEPIVSSSPDPE